jgi:tripartite-type tricarboxylate transporter receptor subunit TctC
MTATRWLWVAAALIFFGAPHLARSDDYPSRPIHLIATSPAGSLIDLFGRLIR